VAIVIIFLFGFLLLINLFQLKFSLPGSDHYIHFGYINSIIKNKNKFITRVKTFINDDDFPDPQLYHWLLSFLPSSILNHYYRYFGLVFNFLSLAFFIIFLNQLSPYLRLNIDYNYYLLICGTIYILTPFEYFTWNAKNVGLSARGFGLMFGHLFVFSITLYAFSGIQLYWIGAIFLGYVILLSSQFAFQFVFFFCLIFSIIIKDFSIALIPVVSTALFLLSFPKWSRVFFQRQWNYKKMYFKVLSKRFGLKARYSIWRDFVYDFWKVMKRRGVVRGLEYIYRNPVIETIVGFPTLIVFACAYFFNQDQPLISSSNTILYQIVATAFIIFVLTSFRPTRFLGEPQRYIEFVFPVICVLAASLGNHFLLIAIIVPSVAIIFFELVGIKMLARRKGGGTTTHEKTLELLQVFNSFDTKNENKVASNNSDVLKYFAENDFRILNINVTKEFTGGLHFNEIFPEKYGNMSLEALLYLSNHYQVNWLILDQNLSSKSRFESKAGMTYLEIKTIHHYTIYRRC
jgi:hypothetical protein